MRARRNLFLALALPALTITFAIGADGLACAAPPNAHAARTLSVQENASLHLVGSHGLTINDRGNAHGTFNCSLAISFTLETAARGSATFTAYPHGGSISGRASAHYSTSGTTGHFEGSMTITGGTGTFKHASGKGLLIKGTIDRYNYSLTAQLSGKVSL
jgi:hypothetical protein